jgi:ribonuclease J
MSPGMSAGTSDAPGVAGIDGPLRLTPLGGVGRFGRNCLLVELTAGDGALGPALLVDCGVRFVADEAPGFDLGLPDLEHIAALGDRLLAYVVTHGHEDHIGALPYAMRENRKPVGATPYTAKLIERRFERTGDPPPEIDVVRAGEERSFGPFRVTWTNVSHSIPDATAVVIRTPVGTIVHSGDFRVDDDPVVGARTDLETLTRFGDEGVLCLLADSTGAMSPGRNAGERSVHRPLLEAVGGARGRVAVALFASHVQRLALLAEVCRATKRRLCLLGTGLKETLRLAREHGLVHIDDVLIDEADLPNFPHARVCLAITGSQGERDSALSRLAHGTHPTARLEPGDRVVLAARVIPGNERRVIDVLEALAERGVEVVDGPASPHVSGHGHAGDLELLLAATRPQTFVALHGNARHLLAHAALARRAGLEAGGVVDLRDGSTLVLDAAGHATHLPGVRAHEPFAAFHEVTLFPREIVDARRRLGSAGALIVVATQEGGAPRLVFRAVAPPVSDELRRLLEADAPRALAAAGTAEEPQAVKALARHFWRARRVPPEIVLVPAAPRAAEGTDAEPVG